MYKYSVLTLGGFFDQPLKKHIAFPNKSLKSLGLQCRLIAFFFGSIFPLIPS